MADEIPDVYVDGVSLMISHYGVNLIFQKTSATPGPMGQPVTETVAIVRMSLEHAKVMTMSLRKNLKQVELETLGDPINLPRAALAQMNLSLEDW